VDNNVHRSFPPPAADDRVVDDLDVGPAGQDSGRNRSGKFRFGPPAAGQRVELNRHYAPWVVLATLLVLAVAVYFLM
jgi:hypothetical protein